MAYQVLWDGSKDAAFQKSQQRPAPPLPVDKRGHVGNTGHVALRNDGGRPNEQGAIDLRLGQFNRDSERRRR